MKTESGYACNKTNVNILGFCSEMKDQTHIVISPICSLSAFSEICVHEHKTKMSCGKMCRHFGSACVCPLTAETIG